MKIPKERVWFAIGLAAIVLYTLVGLFVMDGFGITWDEDAEIQVGKTHLAYLQTGDSTLLEFGTNKALPHYGAAYPVVLQATSRFAQDVFRMPLVDAQHLLLFITGVCAIIGTFLIARLFFSDRIAVLSALFLMCFPRFFAHSFYNSKDILVATIIIWTFYFLYTAIHKKLWKRALIAGIIFGFGCASIVTTVMGVPILVAGYILYRIFESPKSWLSYLRNDSLFIGIFLLSTAITTFTLWPTLWTNPQFFIDSIIFFMKHTWQGDVLYMGKMYTSSTLPWHYAPFFLLIVTPLATVCTFFVGTLVGARDILLKKRRFVWYILAFWFAFPLLLFMKPGSVNYDGIRHFLSAIPPLAIIAGVGANTVLLWVTRRTKQQHLYTIGIVILIGWLLLEIIRIHPFQGSYFNEMTRAVSTPIEEKFETDYWAASYRQAVEWTNENAQKNATVCAPLAAHLLSSYIFRNDLRVDCTATADITFLLTRGGPEKMNENIPPNSILLHTISGLGTNYVLIYGKK